MRKMRVQVRRELRELQQRLGLTTIFVTHDQEEANTICDRIAVMNDGVVQQIGTPMELYEKPANLFVASFLGTANILSGTVHGTGGGRVFEMEGGGRVPIRPEAVVPSGARLVFRPQNAVLLPPGASGPTDLVTLDGEVADREFLGASVRYAVRLGSERISIDVPFQSAAELIAPGTPVTIGFAADKALYLA